MACGRGGQPDAEKEARLVWTGKADDGSVVNVKTRKPNKASEFKELLYMEIGGKYVGQLQTGHWPKQEDAEEFYVGLAKLLCAGKITKSDVEEQKINAIKKLKDEKAAAARAAPKPDVPRGAPSDRQDDPRDEETITRKALRAKAKQAFGLLAREAKQNAKQNAKNDKKEAREAEQKRKREMQDAREADPKAAVVVSAEGPVRAPKKAKGYSLAAMPAWRE